VSSPCREPLHTITHDTKLKVATRHWGTVAQALVAAETRGRALNQQLAQLLCFICITREASPAPRSLCRQQQQPILFFYSSSSPHGALTWSTSPKVHLGVWQCPVEANLPLSVARSLDCTPGCRHCHRRLSFFHSPILQTPDSV